MSDPLICIPGQRLCLMDGKYVPGHGTYEKHKYIYSSLAGTVEFIQKEKTTVLQVNSPVSQTLVPVQGDVVTVEILTITLQYCKCLIHCIENTILSRSYRAILKKENIRATEQDRVEIYKSFRPGDIVLAKVLPIVEAHVYHLTTAENELGVVTANSEHGYPMIPISWTQMQCSKTLMKENRKVAKIVPENIDEVI